MKILMLQDAEWRKKGPHQQHHLMELMSLREHEIMVIGFDQFWREEKGGLISKRIYDENVCRFYEGAKIDYIRPTFIRIPVFDYISFLNSSRNEVIKQIKEFQPDVIIGFASVLSNYWGSVYAKKNNIPYIYYCYDLVHELNVPKPFGFLAELIVKKILKDSDKIIVINEALKDYIIDYGADPNITEVISGGVDFERFNPEKIDRNYYRKIFEIADEDMLLFFMGWLYKFSGLKEVITELSKIKETHPHVKLLIVGKGDAFDDLKNLVETENLEQRVFMTGEMPYSEIPKLIAASDICLLPAYINEVMKHIVPIKIYEYLAMHKPVVVTKLPGVMKEFGNDNGVIYTNKPESVLNIASNLTDEDIKLKKAQARNFIKDYNWEHIVTIFEENLKSLIN